MARRKRKKNPSRTDHTARKPENISKSKLIGRRILARRNELGLSQVGVAKMCGWESTRQWKYEAGASMPKPAAVLTLAKVLRIDPLELIAIRNGNGEVSGG